MVVGPTCSVGSTTININRIVGRFDENDFACWEEKQLSDGRVFGQFLFRFIMLSHLPTISCSLPRFLFYVSSFAQVPFSNEELNSMFHELQSIAYGPEHIMSTP